MVNSIKELVKNVNFGLRLAECIVCLAGTIFCFLTYDTIEYVGPWPITAWFVMSFAFLVLYIFEGPILGLEVLLMVLHFLVMIRMLMETKWTYSTTSWSFTVIIVLLMFIDIVLLISKRSKNVLVKDINTD